MTLGEEQSPNGLSVELNVDPCNSQYYLAYIRAIEIANRVHGIEVETRNPSERLVEHRNLRLVVVCVDHHSEPDQKRAIAEASRLQESVPSLALGIVLAGPSAGKDIHVVRKVAQRWSAGPVRLIEPVENLAELPDLLATLMHIAHSLSPFRKVSRMSENEQAEIMIEDELTKSKYRTFGSYR